MKDLTFIIPVFNLSKKENLESLKALEKSIGQQGNVLCVGSKEDIDIIGKLPVKTLVNDSGDLSYSNQVMLAVNEVDTKYFSVVEQDDIVSENWTKFVEQYIAVDEADEVFAYLPLTEVIDKNTDDTIAYANEAFWATSFSEKLGFLDINCIQDYLNFNTSGAVFKTKEFLALGGLKKSIKLTFWFEFLMRALYKQKQIYVIPRVGYFHYTNVGDSLTEQYTKSMDEKEVEWWVELAKKEYFFPQDRNKKYEE